MILRIGRTLTEEERDAFYDAGYSEIQLTSLRAMSPETSCALFTGIA